MQLKRGMPEGELKTLLIEQSFTQVDIDAVFKPHHYDMRAWYLFFGTIVSLAGFYLFLQTGGLLILILGALLFVAYFFEIKRLEKLKG